MDTGLIVLLLVLSIIAGVFILYEYDRLTCAQEGEHLSDTNALPDVCCSGLNVLASMFVDETGQCQLGAEAPICVSTDCGDGICQGKENHCNCQDDCVQSCAQEGEICGGYQGIVCCSGTCQLDGDYPDASGYCEKEY